MLQAMATLGLFVFNIKTLPYQQLQRTTQWRYPSNSRVSKRPSRQFLGDGDDIVTLSGTLYPELTGGRVSLALVRAMAATGKSWPLIEGTGDFLGLFAIESVDETHTVFFPDGAARKIEFTLKLTRTDDDDLSQLGVMTGTLMSLI